MSRRNMACTYVMSRHPGGGTHAHKRMAVKTMARCKRSCLRQGQAFTWELTHVNE